MKYTETSPMPVNDFTRTINVLTSMKGIALIFIFGLLLYIFGAPIVGASIPAARTIYLMAVIGGCALALIALECYGALLQMWWHRERLTVTDVVFDENREGRRVANVIFNDEANVTVIPYKASYAESFNDLHPDQNLMVIRRTTGFATRQLEGRLA